MASTADGRRLTEAHRLAQARIGARTVQLMLAAWRVMDPEDLDASTGAWLRLVFTIVNQQRSASNGLAASYLTAFRAVELGPGPFRPTFAGDFDVEALTTSLTVTGPVWVKAALARGVSLEEALGLGESMSAGAGMRFALNGGRETLLASVRNDREARGWARATSGAPCAFCAMLASRGGVYKKEDSAEFQAHSSCACTAEPIYDTEADLPAGNAEFRDLWDQSDGTLDDFRRLYEANPVKV